MKCPKCGYLGFEEVARCRNCGHDFTVPEAATVPELPLRSRASSADDPFDLELAAPSGRGPGPRAAATPALHPPVEAPAPAGDLPLFGNVEIGHDALPMLSRAAAPRAPLAVRRSTPEVPRVRPEGGRTPTLDWSAPEAPAPVVVPSVAVRQPTASVRAPMVSADPEAAGIPQRALAAGIDLLILGAIDTLVVYFTLQICGLTIAEVQALPTAPLLAFLLLQNGGYLAAFTAGGQTLGKMTMGIRVVSVDGPTLDLGRSITRTFIWGLLAIPAGLGFATAVFDGDRRGLHDRLAGTRVVRAGIA